MNKRVEAKRTTKKVKIVKAAKERGANEFGQTSKVSAPFKGVNTSRPTNIVYPEIKWQTKAEKPNWKEWRHIALVKIWEACALSLDIDPESIKNNPNSWLAGIGANQLFKDECFQSEKESIEFDRRQKIIFKIISSENNPLYLKINTDHPNLSEILLAEFAELCLSIEWAIPQELEELAKKAGAATPVKSENKAVNFSHENKQESEETSAQDRITDVQNKDKKDALFIAAILLSKGGVLDEVIGLAIQKAESLHRSKVWAELWKLSTEKKMPFTGGAKEGGLPYYGSSHGATKRLTKKALDKRLVNLKKKCP